ncbi:hypothetical protein TanjilG_15333 [Lupinus angustifolius]|uniref:Uncharacterized protein n=1 Tax=Lupinus angustifolius TaxID=3871 RepID=A0A1J7IAH5_LUPAN|nr:hypothetical protein TanjilG_15333 [Lupinus angustifolius]
MVVNEGTTVTDFRPPAAMNNNHGQRWFTVRCGGSSGDEQQSRPKVVHGEMRWFKVTLGGDRGS